LCPELCIHSKERRRREGGGGAEEEQEEGEKGVDREIIVTTTTLTNEPYYLVPTKNFRYFFPLIFSINSNSIMYSIDAKGIPENIFSK
jgi:hypothetical protein